MFLIGLLIGAFIGLFVVSIIVSAKSADNRLYEWELAELLKRLQDEEKNNDLLKAANESLRDDLNELEERYEQLFIDYGKLSLKKEPGNIKRSELKSNDGNGYWYLPKTDFLK